MSRSLQSFLLLAVFAAGTLFAFAGEDFQAAPAPDPSRLSAQELESRADALRREKDFNTALDYYNLALRKDRKNAVLWNKAGMAELQLGRYDRARNCFQRAVKIDKTYAEAVNNVGVVLYLRREYSRAILQYRRALALKDSASFHTNLGAAYFDSKDLRSAMAEYLRAFELDPDVFERTSLSGISAHVLRPEDRANFAFLMARLYARVGDTDRSIAQLKRALENGYSKMKDIYSDDDFAVVRQDPRFAQLMGTNTPAVP